MAAKQQALDPERVRTIAREDADFWALLQTRQEADQALVERATDFVKTEGDDADSWQAFTNDPAVIIYKGSAMLAGQRCKVSVPQVAGADDQMRDAVQKVEDLSRFIWEEIARRHANGFGNNLEFDMWQSFFLRGVLAMRVLRNAENDNFFWDVLLADPITVKLRYAGKKLIRVSHVYQSTAIEVKDDFFPDGTYPAWLEAMKDGDTVKVTAFYDNKQMAVCADQSGQEWLKEPTDHGCVDENGNGVVPWVIRTGAGAFYRATEKDQTNWVKYVAESLLARVRGAISNKDQVLAMLHALVAQESNPTKDIFSENVKEYDGRDGAKNFLDPNDKVEWRVPQMKIQDLSALGSAYQDQINQGALDKILFGQGDPNISGLLANAQAGSAKDVLTPYVLSMQDAKQAVTRLCLLYFRDGGAEQSIVHTDAQSGRRLQGTVVQYAHVLDAGTYVEFKYRNFTPQDEVAMGNLAAVLVREGLMSMETARERFLDVDNPSLENTKVLGDMAYKDPKVVQLVSALAVVGLAQGNGLTMGQLAQIVQSVNAMLQTQQGAPGAPAGQPGSGQAPPEVPPQLPAEALPPEVGSLAGVVDPNGTPIGPAASAAPVPTAQNLDLGPLLG